MRIDGTQLGMIRGDSEYITINCKDEHGVKINFQTGDRIYFTVKLNTATDQKVLQKIVTSFDDGNAVVEILPEDTRDLPYKSYKYDIQWTTVDSKIITIIPPSIFSIEPEITFESV